MQSSIGRQAAQTALGIGVLFAIPACGTAQHRSVIASSDILAGVQVGSWARRISCMSGEDRDSVRLAASCILLGTQQEPSAAIDAIVDGMRRDGEFDHIEQAWFSCVPELTRANLEKELPDLFAACRTDDVMLLYEVLLSHYLTHPTPKIDGVVLLSSIALLS